MVSEQQAAVAVAQLRKIIEAAENSNQAGEDAAVMAAAASNMTEALTHCLGILCEAGDLNNYRNLSDSELGKAWIETAKEAAAALAKARGEA